MRPASDPRCRHRLLTASISHAVWLYHVFSLIRFLLVTVHPYTGRDMSIMAKVSCAMQQPDQTLPYGSGLLRTQGSRSTAAVHLPKADVNAGDFPSAVMGGCGMVRLCADREQSRTVTYLPGLTIGGSCVSGLQFAMVCSVLGSNQLIPAVRTIDSSPGRLPNRLEYDSLCVSRRFAGSAIGWAGRSRSAVLSFRRRS
jgi:hypothetical protein